MEDTMQQGDNNTLPSETPDSFPKGVPTLEEMLDRPGLTKEQKEYIIDQHHSPF